VRVQWHWAHHGMCLEGTPMDPPVDIAACNTKCEKNVSPININICYILLPFV